MTFATMLITQVCIVTENIKNRTLKVFKEGTIGKRLAQIANASIVLGIGWLTSKSKIAALYKPLLASKEKEKESVLLGTTSNIQ